MPQYEFQQDFDGKRPDISAEELAVTATAFDAGIFADIRSLVAPRVGRYRLTK